MMPWSMEQKIFCVKTYYETKSFQIVQARFRTKFSFNKFPNSSQIFKLVKMFETHGTCGDRRVTVSSPSGPSITIRTPDNVTRVQESVGRSPSNSLRRSQELGISVSSWHIISDLSTNNCRLLNVIFSPFNKCNHHCGIIWNPGFVPNIFVSTIVKHPVVGFAVSHMVQKTCAQW